MDLHGKLIGFKRLFCFENWVQLFLDRLFFSKTKSVIHRLEGMEVLIDYSVGEQNGTGSCVAHMSYALFIDSFALSRSQELRVLDLGANGGGFGLMLHRMGFSFSKLVAVEMNRRTFGRLSFNLMRNLNGEIVLINGAIAERDGRIELPDSDGGIGDSLYGSVTGAVVTRSVEMHALDRVLRDNFGDHQVDVIKIDIEGAEFDLLESPVIESIRQARHVIIEIHERAPWTWEKVHQKFAELGFDLSPVRSPYEENVFAYTRKLLS